MHRIDLMEDAERLNERANRAVNRGKQLPPPLCSIGLATRAVARNAFIERNLSKLTIHRLENDYHYKPVRHRVCAFEHDAIRLERLCVRASPQPTSLELEEEGLEEATVQQVVDLQTLTLEHIMNLRMKMALAGNSPTASATDPKDDTKSEGSLSPEEVEKIKQVRSVRGDSPCLRGLCALRVGMWRCASRRVPRTQVEAARNRRARLISWNKRTSRSESRARTTLPRAR